MSVQLLDNEEVSHIILKICLISPFCRITQKGYQAVILIYSSERRVLLIAFDSWNVLSGADEKGHNSLNGL